MKAKLLLLTALFALAGMAFAQDTQALEFEKRVHDFGSINETDGRVEAVFEFKNIIGCLTVKFP